MLELTEKSIYLTENHPERLKYSAVFGAGFGCVAGIENKCISGKSFLSTIMVNPISKKLTRDKKSSRYIILQWMNTQEMIIKTLQKIDLDGIETVADVSGGSGN